MDAPRFVTCGLCGDRIGTYEPIVVDDGAGGRLTSRVREPDLDRTAARLLHARCAEGVGITAGSGPRAGA